MAKYKKSADNKKEEAAEQTKMLDLGSVLKAEMDDAKDYISQIGEERAESTEYYLGNEPEETSTLQSRFVSTDVRDTILFMLPSIMRTFFGTKKIVEFVPYGPEDIPVAEQQTNYINYIVQEKNPGFKILYDVFKDALVRKAGYVKAFWDDSISASTHEYTNIDPAQYQALVMDENVEIISESVEMSTMTMIDPMTNEEVTQESPASYDLTIRRIKEKNQVCIEAIPPEEVLIARHARSLEESSYVAHRMVKTVSDLVAMGYDKDEVAQHAGYGSSAVDVDAFEEQMARNPFDNVVYPDRADTGSKDVLYVEHYLFYDLDEDGIDERVRVCTAGEGLHIMDMQPFDELPIISFCPDPEPHTAIGSCPADYLKLASLLGCVRQGWCSHLLYRLLVKKLFLF